MTRHTRVARTLPKLLLIAQRPHSGNSRGELLILLLVKPLVWLKSLRGESYIPESPGAGNEEG